MKVNPLTNFKIRGIFLRRINRFTVEVELENRKTLAYLPNPGRLWELLLPGTEVLLFKNKGWSKLAYTVLAAKKNELYVLLHTHLTNFLVKNLLQEGQISFLSGYEIVKEEVTFEKNRFDLLLKDRLTKEKLFLEVKTCTLFGKRMAMFPDAPTSRGKRHLLELTSLVKEKKVQALCLYVIMNPEIEYFLPSYHIDLEFTKAFLSSSSYVSQKAIALQFDEKLERVIKVREVEVPYAILEREAQDRGAYLLLIELKEAQRIKVGGLGEIDFAKGFYVYVGSAKKNLTKRIERHIRKNKTKYWHVDYLLEKGKGCREISFRTSKQNLECFLAKELSKIAESFISKFGSSDCECASHLYYFLKNPLENSKFVEFINLLRLDLLPFNRVLTN
ncbi:MAG: DNA/RNA nuclease SfsA [Thermodesulfobacteriaceae bacterium]|nr:DNA/RNA nuclease SfsA [Thermodesulfobacteriaceae bacterium]